MHANSFSARNENPFRPCAHAQGYISDGARLGRGGTVSRASHRWSLLSRAGLLLFLALSASSPAQTTVSGTLAVGGGGALVDGDQPAFQQFMRQRKDGYGGLETFAVSRISDTSLFRFDGRFIEGNDDYRLNARFERFDAFYVETNYRSFRTFYDGSGGRLRPRDLAISWFDENLALDRSYFTFEAGTLLPNAPQWKIGYARNTRDGTKNSIRWGDSNLGGPGLSPRAFIPSYYLIDEQREIGTAEVSQRTDNTHWKIAGRYERTRVRNTHVARRRALENQDRFVTSRDGMKSDLFSGHAFYERIFNEKFRWSAGGLITAIDSNLSGSKIYGGTPEAEYSATFARRQTGDVGYFGLTGNAELKQYLGNLNLVYQPVKYWTVRGGLKYEHLRQDSGENHTDTDFGGGAAAAAVQRMIEASNRNSWNEVTEEVEARYTRWSNWVLNARAQWTQGTGNLVEQSILTTTQARVIDRETDYDRLGQRYTVNANWYMRPGLTFGAQYNYRLKLADYDHLRDSNNSNFDRYPAFIIDQDIATHDANFRLSWRPKSMLGFVTRYAHQRSTITSTMMGLPEIENGHLTRHVVSQTATWNPMPRLHVMAGANLTYDQLEVPRHRLTFNSDNNYVQGTLGIGYALGKVTDVYLDANHYRSDNYIDNSSVTLPMAAGQKLQSAFLTWVHRHTETLIYTAKYGYATSRDGMFAGQNDFDAHLFYAKVQYKF